MVLVAERLIESEFRAQFRRERFRRVANNRKPAALRRAVQRERRDDRLAAGFQNASQVLDVSSTIRGIRQKVKDCAIVPEIDRRRAPLAGNIRLNPRHGRARQAFHRAAERHSRDVDDGDAAEPARHEMIHEAGISAPHVNHSGARTEPRRLEQTQRAWAPPETNPDRSTASPERCVPNAPCVPSPSLQPAYRPWWTTGARIGVTATEVSYAPVADRSARVQPGHTPSSIGSSRICIGRFETAAPPRPIPLWPHICSSPADQSTPRPPGSRNS
jgi:hypothetical protein